MEDILKQFLREGEILLNSAPYAFFDLNDLCENNNANGIHIVWFLMWSNEHSGCSKNIQEKLGELNPVNFDKTRNSIEIAQKITENSLKPEHLVEPILSFANRYFRTGWKHSYLSDLEELFPDTESFSHLPPNISAYTKVRTLLDSRLKEFYAR
jgi:hypothetical protein